MRPMDDVVENLAITNTIKGPFTRQCFVGNRRDGPNVGTLIELGRTLRLLRGHVVRGANRRAYDRDSFGPQ